MVQQPRAIASVKRLVEFARLDVGGTAFRLQADTSLLHFNIETFSPGQGQSLDDTEQAVDRILMLKGGIALRLLERVDGEFEVVVLAGAFGVQAV